MNNESADIILSKLIASTCSPRGGYLADNSWRLLEQRLRKHRTLRKLWPRAISSAAVTVLGIASWAAYNAFCPEVPETVPPVETQISVPIAADQSLIFKQQTLEEITRQLSERFHTKIHIEEENLKSYRMTATFKEGESLIEILDLLKNAGNFTYKKTNKAIVITKLN